MLEIDYTERREEEFVDTREFDPHPDIILEFALMLDKLEVLKWKVEFMKKNF